MCTHFYTSKVASSSFPGEITSASVSLSAKTVKLFKANENEKRLKYEKICNYGINVQILQNLTCF
jgi:hypothetical protein